MDRKEAVTILQEKRDLARMLEAAEKSADWAAKDRVDSSSLRASQHGRYADALDMAISALSPPNEPLTIEQLREMDGEPVWIANPDALEYGRWGIVDGVYQAEDDQVLMLRGDYSCHYYGKTWLAYRRPSEGEENAQ
ncbi:hypothetical protein [Dysosmobacter welbionis]|uniref:hypothetical protein n=1 Tax=Dysosmobacter welbionis TaxID=2093857 RepID=UPI002943E00C|nr:hypothetical protein [Dysosmobacter welbionis]